MTVNNASNKISYIANGSTVDWVFPFPAVDAQFLQVFVTNPQGFVNQLNPAFYTVVLDPLIGANPTSQGGKVTYPLAGPPLANGNQITIARVLPSIQKYSIANQSIIYPPIIEQEFDYLTLLQAGGVDELSRAFKVGFGDPLPADVPPVAERANQGAFFDAVGDLVPGLIPGPGVFISAAMQPVVEATTLDIARDLLGISTIPLVVSNTFTVLPENERRVIDLEGNFYTVTVPISTGFRPQFWIFIYNRSDRGKLISVDGYPSFILWPRQFTWVFNSTNGWLTTNPGRWRALIPQQFYVHPTLGNDSNDGLATGTQAWRTIQHGVSVVEDLVDGNFTINLADGVHNVGSGVTCSKGVLGANGYKIVGNVSTPVNCNVQSASGGGCFRVIDNASVLLSGVYLNSDSGCLTAETGGVITVGNVTFGESRINGYHMCAQYNGVINVNAPYDLRGGAHTHLLAVSGGTIFWNPGTCTFSAIVTMESSFINAQGASTIFSTVDNTFIASGNLFGPNYIVLLNSVVSMRPSPGYPGTSTGTVATGGQIV